MKLERRKAKRTQQAAYPTGEKVLRNRRDFLKILGKGLLAIPAVGLVGCGIGREKEEEGELMGILVMPEDWTPEDVTEDTWEHGIDVGGVAPPPDIETPDEDWVSPGGPIQLDIESADTCTTAKDIGPDFPPLPGEAPEPDVKTGQDVEDEETWELMGDMPAPE